MKFKFLLFIFIILLGTLISSCSSKPSKYDSFAQCLTEKGAVMYGTNWCSHCQNQKKAFGKSFKYINYVDCDRNKKECVLVEVEGYPTWKINEVNYPGEQLLSRLASLSGCEI